MKRLLIPIGIALAIILIGGMGYLGFRSTQSSKPATISSIPQTVPVSRGEVQHSVTAPGKLVGTREATLSSDAGGRLAKINVRPGDAVHAGQVLAVLDTADLELRVAQAEQTYLKQQAAYSDTIQSDPNAVLAARTAVSNASAAYQVAKRQFDLRGDQTTVSCLGFKNASDALALAQAAYDSVANDWKAKDYLNSDWGPFRSVVNNLTNAQSAYELARAQCHLTAANINDSSLQSALAQLKQAEANLEQLVSPESSTLLQAQAQLEQTRLTLDEAQQQLANATILAPFAGVVLDVKANPGEAIGAHSALIVLADPAAVEVESTVIEEDMSFVKAGQLVNLFFDAKPDAGTTGHVARSVPQRTSGDRLLYPVYVAIDQLPTGLVAGMTVDASIVVDSRSGVLRLPRELVRVRSDDTALVRVWTGDQIEQRTITIGLRGDSFVEVLAGLSEGDRVVGE